MSPKWRSRSDQPGKGKHYQVDEREPTRLPVRAGLEPTERVAGVHDRGMIGPTTYLCPDCGHRFDSSTFQRKCPNCGSLNLERSLGGNKWIKADADESATHLIHTKAEADSSYVEAMKTLDHKYLDGNIQKEQYEKERKKLEASELRNQANKLYVQGKISQATWRAKMNRADRLSAPNTDEVLNTMEKRSFEQGRPTDENQRYNGWSNHDTWNTKLLLDNTQETDKWQHAWGKNWLLKIKQGKFDPEKAELVVSKYLVPTARGKNKRFAGPDFTPDPSIDPKKVNKAEIVHSIISEEAEEEKYEASHKEG